MRPRSEAAAVDDITKLLTRRRAWWMKTTGVRRIGAPDLVACYHGRFLAIEVKRARAGTHPVSAAQRVTLEQITRARGVAIVATTSSDIEAILDTIDQERPDA
jgi:Holliday junction resolvase